MTAMNYRFQLDKSGKKYLCPGCTKYRFVRYVDLKKGCYLPDEFGKCDRENNCQYHKSPYKTDYAKMIWAKENGQDVSGYKLEYSYLPPVKMLPKQLSIIEPELMQKSLKGYNHNNFVKFLYSRFPEKVVSAAISLYKVGTSKHWPGASVFWQIDCNGLIRAGKIMLYNPDTGKRVKEPINHITWIHKVMQFANFDLKQCFFGEHLTTESSKRIAIVESEKTAIICSLYYPEFTWLATGQKHGLTVEKFSPLRNKYVILFPDLNAFDDWKQKQREITQEYPRVNIMTSDFLETRATDEERKSGLDLADYLLNFKLDEIT